jgi:thioredoxin-related protein
MSRFPTPTILLLLAYCLAAAPGSASADAPRDYPFVSFDEGLRLAEARGQPLFVYFGRYGCGYCEKTNKEAFSDATVRRRYSANYVLAYVDAESGKRLRLPGGERITERELGTRYQALVTPVFSFLTAGGDPLLRMIGVQSKQDLLEADQTIQDALGLARTE